MAFAGFLAVLVLTSSTASSSGAAIWTDKSDYAPGETVTIYGIGFVANANGDLTLTRPDHTVESRRVNTDG